MSALLFILYVSDLEMFLRSRGVRGVSVNNTEEILLLMYADDLVLLAYSKIEMQKILNHLELYCNEKGLTVNVKKSNLVVFKQGRRSVKDEFQFNGEAIEIKSTFSYLGVIFSSSGLYAQAANHAKMKTGVACSSVIKTLVNSRSQSWETKKHLFETISKSTLLYGSEVWALRYLEDLEASQMKFYKTILQVSRSTPGYKERTELGITKIAYWVIKQTLKWWLRLLQMPDDRYPKICYNSLKEKHDRCPNRKYNWVTQLQAILQTADKLWLWEAQDPEVLKEEIESILEFYKHKCIIEDEERCAGSSYSSLYYNISEGHTLVPIAQYTYKEPSVSCV